MTLPAPRTPGHYRITLVCLGNICRSPMAEVVLADRVAAAGLDDRIELSSSGTGEWHVGRAMDPRAAQTLTTAGYDASRHRARQLDSSSLDANDLVLVMDRQNLADVRAITEETGMAPGDRLRMYRDLDPRQPGEDVPDPYYGGDEGFEEVLAMVERTADAWATALSRLPDLDAAARLEQR